MVMSRGESNPYDEVLYPSFPFSYTHPDRMAAVAALFGFEAAPVTHCRVLELGCSDGVNLLGMAVSLPASEFVGVDLAGKAIARGQAMIEALGLKNITLRHLDLLEMAPDYGTFDYIIVHGLYSWVRLEVRDQILAICHGSLAPRGIAYVSYTTLPGGHFRVMLREMMLFHTREFKEPKQIIQQALTLAKLLAKSTPDHEAYTAVLKEEFERISERSPDTLYHDELADDFEPVYFHQFMEHASRHDLQFLGEAEFFEMQGLTANAREMLAKIADDICLKEQYLDFLRGRAFRRTLLCHRDVVLDRSLSPARIRSLFVSCAAEPTSKSPDFSPHAEESFRCGSGAATTTANPLARAMLWYMIEVWPQRISLGQLCAETEARARSRLGFVPASDQDVTSDIADFILAMYSAGLVELHVHVPPFISRLSERPCASPLARLQARHGHVVTTLTHRGLHTPGAIVRGLITLMDGTRDLATLKADLIELLRTGALPPCDCEEEPIQDPQAIPGIVEEKWPSLLALLPRAAILMA
jgi:methyltransferase-like protein/ubiquinone/menaquinone biosynthesis C-methylase UbiE